MCENEQQHFVLKWSVNCLQVGVRGSAVLPLTKVAWKKTLFLFSVLLMFRLSRGTFINKFVNCFDTVKSDIGEEVHLKWGLGLKMQL